MPKSYHFATGRLREKLRPTDLRLVRPRSLSWVRSSPDSDQRADIADRQLRANIRSRQSIGQLAITTGAELRPMRETYSITSLALASNVAGICTPSAFAVSRLMTSSIIVGCSTGRSAGFAPLRILST
jgi:hypothetical protein